MPYRDDIPGFMTLAELQIIEKLAFQVQRGGAIVEVGSHFGRSAWTWAKSADISVKVYCIDPWLGKDHLGEYKSSLEEFASYTKECQNIIPIKGHSPDMVWDDKLSVDLAFIDGRHTCPEVDRDIAFWSQKVKKEGLLCGHDFDFKKRPGVCSAVLKFAKKHKLQARVFRNTALWVIAMTEGLNHELEMLSMKVE